MRPEKSIFFAMGVLVGAALTGAFMTLEPKDPYKGMVYCSNDGYGTWLTKKTLGKIDIVCEQLYFND